MALLHLMFKVPVLGGDYDRLGCLPQAAIKPPASRPAGDIEEEFY